VKDKISTIIVRLFTVEDQNEQKPSKGGLVSFWKVNKAKFTFLSLKFFASMHYQASYIETRSYKNSIAIKQQELLPEQDRIAQNMRRPQFEHLCLRWTIIRPDSATAGLPLYIPNSLCRMPVHPQIINEHYLLKQKTPILSTVFKKTQ